MSAGISKMKSSKILMSISDNNNHSKIWWRFFFKPARYEATQSFFFQFFFPSLIVHYIYYLPLPFSNFPIACRNKGEVRENLSGLRKNFFYELGRHSMWNAFTSANWEIRTWSEPSLTFFRIMWTH